MDFILWCFVRIIHVEMESQVLQDDVNTRKQCNYMEIKFHRTYMMAIYFAFLD